MSAKRMFEFVEGSSSKFWEIWRDGTDVRTRYGRIGSDGQTTVKSEADDAKAQKLYDKLVKEKTGKGYVEVSGGDAPVAAVAPAPAPAKAKKAAAKKAEPEDDEDEESDDGDSGGGDGGWARYEVDEKFWSIKLDGSSHTVKFGKIGASGTEKTKDFDDEAAARKDHDKLVKEKTGKGYTLVAGAASATAAPKPAKASKKAPALHPWLASLGYRSSDFDADDVYLFACSLNGDGDLVLRFDGTAGTGTFVCAAAALDAASEKIHVAQGGVMLSQTTTSVDEETPTDAFPPFVLSRAMFATLKSGKAIDWPTVLTGDGKTVPVTKTQAGTKKITVNGKKQTVKTIEAAGDDVTLVVLDDADWPIVLVDSEADECGWVLKQVGPDLDADAISEGGDDDGDEDEDEGDDDGDDEGDDEGGDDEEGGGWRRFEVDEKFWSISLSGSSHTVRYGKLGTDGQEKTKDFDDEAAAKKDYDKLIKEKTGKGYEEVGDD